MERNGEFVSPNANISINFRTQNEEDVLRKFAQIPEILNYDSTNKNETIEHKIFFEKGGPFILVVKTNLCERPLKFILDIRAAISIVADNIVDNDLKINDFKVNIFGIENLNTSTTTKGMVNSILTINNTLMSTNLHLVGGKYLGPADGCLGLDFLLAYKVIIDLSNMCILLNLKKIIKSEIENETNIRPKNGQSKRKIKENIMNIYKFESENTNEIKKSIKKMPKSSKSKFNPTNEKNFSTEKMIFNNSTCSKIIPATQQCSNSLPNSNDKKYKKLQRIDTFKTQCCPKNEQPPQNSSVAITSKSILKNNFENNPSNRSQLYFFKDYG